MLAESREFHSTQLFHKIYDLMDVAPHSSPRRGVLSDAADRAVRLLEQRRIEARRVRYGFIPDGPFRVVEWVEQYDGRDAIIGHSSHTLARFGSYEDAERFIECEYPSERDRAEYHLEIKGPFCEVCWPLFRTTTTTYDSALLTSAAGVDDNELPF